MRKDSPHGGQCPFDRLRVNDNFFAALQLGPLWGELWLAKSIYAMTGCVSLPVMQDFQSVGFLVSKIEEGR